MKVFFLFSLFLYFALLNECKADELSIQSLIDPTPVQTTGGKIIVYELHIKNNGSQPVTVDRIEVIDPSNPTDPLAVYADEKLKRNSAFFTHDTKLGTFKRLHGIENLTPGTHLTPETESIVFIDITLKSDQLAPKKLQHKIWTTTLIDRKKLIVNKLDYEMFVNNVPPIVLEHPLKGKNWIAEAAVSSTSYHRRALMPIDGKLYLAQRFAIDWVHADSEGQEVKDNLNIPENWASYGREVFAVSDGIVTKVNEGLQNQVPPGLPVLKGSPAEILKNATGNSILLSTEQQGQKVYILYAHLKPDSILVKPGDHVKAGQHIANAGNTGNSASPHLHMHVCNANSPLQCEGLPFVFKKANLQGTAGVISIDYGQWKWNKKLEDNYTMYDNIMPTENQVFNFSEK